MKKLLGLIVILVAACQPVPDLTAPSSATSPSPAQPSVVTTTPVDTTAPLAPVVVQAPVVVNNPPPALQCFENNLNVICTGGANLGSAQAQIDLESMFTNGNMQQQQVAIVSIQNNVTATHFAICTQPNGVGCIKNSVCLNVLILTIASHTQTPYTLCGNEVNTLNDNLVDQQ